MKNLITVGITLMTLTLAANADEAWRGELVRVRNVTAHTEIKDGGGPGTDNILSTTLTFDVLSLGCARATDFKVVNNIGDGPNRMGVLSILRDKPEDTRCPNGAQKLPQWQKIRVTLPDAASWAGEGQVLQNSIVIPTQMK